MYTKEIAASVRQELKETLPLWKFSVQIERFAGGSAINLALMSGPDEVLVGSSYAQLNKYAFVVGAPYVRQGENYINNGNILTPAGFEVMNKATAILSKYHRDDSNYSTDFFSCNFYMHIAIGKWNKGYEVKG